jgi:uncharacterized protein (DUF305 family)
MRKLLMIAALGALAGLSGAQADDMSGMKMGTAKPDTSASDKAYVASMRKMMKDMHVPPTGDADADFVNMMLPHHVGAVDMAKVELQYGKDPELRALAEGIVAAQEKEIAQMNAWKGAHKK